MALANKSGIVFTDKRHSKIKKVHSLRGTLILSFVLVFCAMISVLLYYIFGVARVTRQQTEDNFKYITTASKNRIEHILSASQEAAMLVSYSNSVQKYLLSKPASIVIESKTPAFETMTYANIFGDGFVDIVLFSTQNRKVSATNSYEAVVREALDSNEAVENMIFKKPFYSSVIPYNGKEYIVYLTPVYGNIDGYRYRDNAIVCGVIYSMEELLDNLILSSYEESAAVLLRESTLLGSTKELSDEEISILNGLETGQALKKIGHEKYFVSRAEIEGTDWELVYLVPEQSVTVSYDQVRSVIVMLIMAFMLLIAVLMLLILAVVRKDIEGMSEDIRAMDFEDRPVRKPSVMELQPISDVINHTMADLHESMRKEQKLIADSYEARLAQNRAEMLAYRSQINPHFLFNTLESVRSMAHRYGAQPVEQLVGGMSQMFRYSLYSPMIVPLEDELGHLGSYFSIMDVRFPGRYRIMEDIQPETLSWPMLSMLLQPLAENAILHAFPGRKNGVILVQSFIQDDRLVVRIADNGVGMDEQLLDVIVQKMKNTSGETAHIDGHSDQGPEHKSSIGLPNIYRRLKLTFGEHAHLIIRSKEGYYTVAELQIPQAVADRFLPTRRDTPPQSR